MAHCWNSRQGCWLSAIAIKMCWDTQHEEPWAMGQNKFWQWSLSDQFLHVINGEWLKAYQTWSREGRERENEIKEAVSHWDFMLLAFSKKNLRHDFKVILVGKGEDLMKPRSSVVEETIRMWSSKYLVLALVMMLLTSDFLSLKIWQWNSRPDFHAQSAFRTSKLISWENQGSGGQSRARGDREWSRSWHRVMPKWETESDKASFWPSSRAPLSANRPMSDSQMQKKWPWRSVDTAKTHGSNKNKTFDLSFPKISRIRHMKHKNLHSKTTEQLVGKSELMVI